MLYFLFCLATLIYFTNAAENCDACINNICYEKITFLDGCETNGQIACDLNSNIIYFYAKNLNLNNSHTVGYSLHDKKTLIVLWSEEFSFARAVDQKTGDVYTSGVNSVYKTNPNKEFNEKEKVFDASIWRMQYKDKLYYCELNTNGIKTYENNQHKEIEGLSQYKIQDFIVDKNNDIYFISETSLYRLKNGKKVAKLLAEEVYILMTDKLDEAYFIQPFTKSIYKVDYSTNILVEIGAIKAIFPYKAVFTSENNIIYSDATLKVIYFLNSNGKKCHVSRNIISHRTYH